MNSFSRIAGLGLSLATMASLTPAPADAAVPLPVRSVAWQLLPGRAVDVGASTNGAVWRLSTEPVAGGYRISTWSPATRAWVGVDGGGVRIAAAADGTPWLVNDVGHVFVRTGLTWSYVPSPGASDIGAGGGEVWIVGRDSVPGGSTVYRWTGSGWAQANAGAVRVSVSARGTAWLVNSANRIFREDGEGWLTMHGLATDIGSGTRTWITGANSVPGGYSVFVHDGTEWQNVPGGLRSISVGARGEPWAVNSLGETFRGVVTESGSASGCRLYDLDVPEASSGVSYVVQPGQTVTFTPGTEEIWSGAIGGTNGPAGWSALAQPGWNYPLAGARIYGLLVKTPGAPSWSYLGAAPLGWSNRSSGPQTLSFRPNDNVPGNGSGAFIVYAQHSCFFG